MDQLLVALDVESGERALQIATSLKDIAGGVKVGSRLFTLEGLRGYMQRHGIARISEITGTLDTSAREKAWISS